MAKAFIARSWTVLTRGLAPFLAVTAAASTVTWPAAQAATAERAARPPA